MSRRSRIFVNATSAKRFPLGADRTDQLEFDLSEQLVCESHEQLYIMLESACIPMGRPNVTLLNNQLTTVYNSTLYYTAAFNEGQYGNAAFLVAGVGIGSTFATNASCYLTYNAILNKITFMNTTAAPVTVLGFASGQSSMAWTIGVGVSDLLIPASGSAMCPCCVDLSDAKMIKMVVNLGLACLDVTNGSSITSSVLAAIPVSVPYGALQTYQDQSGILLPCTARALSSLTIKLFDEQGSPLDIQGVEWACVITVVAM